MRPLRHYRLWLALGFALVAYVVFGSLTPSPQHYLPVHYWDKAEHASAYTVMALWFGCIYTRNRHAYVGSLLLSLGVALEFVQACVGRDFQVTDMLADALGIALGLALALTPLGRVFVQLESWAGKSVF